MPTPTVYNIAYKKNPQVLVATNNPSQPLSLNKPHVWSKKIPQQGGHSIEFFVLMYIEPHKNLNTIDDIRLTQNGSQFNLDIVLTETDTTQHPLYRLVLFSLIGFPSLTTPFRNMKTSVLLRTLAAPTGPKMFQGEVTIVFDDPDDEMAGGDSSQV